MTQENPQDDLRDEIESLRDRIRQLEARHGIEPEPDHDPSLSAAVKEFIREHQGYDRGVTHDVLVSDVSGHEDATEDEVEAALERLQQDGEVYSVEQSGTRRWKVS